MSKNNIYIIKNSLGHIYKFIFEDNIIHRYRTDINPNIKYEIIRNVTKDFFVEIDENDKIHLLCQSIDGKIIYLINEQDTKEKRILLHTKSINDYNKFFKIIFLQTSINFFYIIRKTNKYLLIHQTIVENKLSEPNVIDYINYDSAPYNVSKDVNDNIWVFYDPFSDYYKRIGYKAFINKEKKWSDYIEISKSEYNQNIPFVLIDNCNNIHLIWNRKNNDICNVIYQKILPYEFGENSINLEIILYSNNIDINNVFLIMLNNNLFAIWQSDDDIFTCISNDNHLYWNKPYSSRLDSHENFSLIYYSTNYEYERNHLLVKQIFGNIDNEIYLFLINNLSNFSTEYIEEIAITNDSENLMNEFGLYFQNIKSNFYKLASQITSLEADKQTINIKYLDLEKQNKTLKNKIIELENYLEQDELDKGKLIYEKNAFEDKIRYLSKELVTKENEYKRISQQINKKKTNGSFSIKSLFKIFRKKKH